MALEFDPNKTFDENIAEFRAHLDGIDPACAKIFFDNLSTLIGDGDPNRARSYRTGFNEDVLQQLQTEFPRATGS
jgi:hypothetical protein